jgi:hypothetical protein
MPFPKRPSPDEPLPKHLSLVDGGVYDNLGLEWFQGWTEDALRPDEAVKPNFLVIANASGILEYKNKRFRPPGALMRELAIQYQQVLALRTRWWFAALKSSSVYMAIKDDVRRERHAPALTEFALPSDFVKPLALLRTDLDRFDQAEADLLSYHAYWTLHVRLAEGRPGLELSNPSWKSYAAPSKDELARLEIGSHRFFRRTRRLWRRLRGS